MPSFLEFLCPHEAIYNIKVSWGKSYTNTSYLHASSRAFATDSSSVQIEGHAEGPPVLACRIPHSSWAASRFRPRSWAITVPSPRRCSCCFATHARNASYLGPWSRQEWQPNEVLYFDQVTCSSVVSSIMHVPCLSTVAPQELFVKCVGSCWQRLGALTTEPRSLGVRISTCHRHPQKLAYYARKAHQAALVSTSMNAASTATKTQGKPNHWLSQLETKHNKAMYCTVFGMHIVGHIMARSENP